ncbi:NADPH:quinone oxidoreductase family protein [Dermatobacter hominis]|uniref:NADPH:quinone oxidoreductase family protein n=1 Tax=Dermatobacter hominis TaxID=2884263 RepID=UPI001D108B13|nr:NADPH:quinone oxidoreductase family protein [Dermatobacter hominis]UDY36113.1 NADPH:quinone oxidoreductase family protein [Dermatobacter hominis]
MRALQVTRHGEPEDVLAVVDVEPERPGPGEVRIRAAAAALNHNDIARCRGTLVSVAKDPPFTIGMDLCGTVDAVGPGAEEWLGRRVVAIAKDALGGIAEQVVAPAAGVFDAPAGLDDVQAAAFLIPFHTTHLALFRRGGLADGDTLLVTAAASGLGTAAVQLGSAAGARVIAAVGSADKAEVCTQLGADDVVVLGAGDEAVDLADSVLDLTADHGADVVCDLVGGDLVAPSWRCTAREGRYLAVGFTDDDQNGMTGRPIRMASIGNFSIVGVLGAWVDDLDPGMRRFGFNPFTRADGDEVHAALCQLVADGRITPHVGRVVTMDEAGAALADHRDRRSTGRTIVQIA